MTHREFLVWKRHFDDNPPIECYLMQIAAEIEMSRTLKFVSAESKRLSYEDKDEESEPEPVSPEEVKAVSEARRKMLLARIGGRKDGNGRRS